MTETTLNVMAIFGSFLGALFVIAKLVLPKILDVYVNRIEHIHNRDLKVLGANLHSQLEKVKSAVEIAHKSQEELRCKRIAAVENIWEEILRLEREFAPLVATELILTEKELNELFWNNGIENETREEVFKRYSSFEQITQKIGGNDIADPAMQLAFAMDTTPRVQEELKIFVTDKLWRIYEALIRVYGRLGFLVSQAATKKEKVNWRADGLMKSIIEKIFQVDALAIIQNQNVSIQTLVYLLHEEFIVEAQKVMQGTELFREKTEEVHEIIERLYADSKHNNVYKM